MGFIVLEFIYGTYVFLLYNQPAWKHQEELYSEQIQELLWFRPLFLMQEKAQVFLLLYSNFVSRYSCMLRYSNGQIMCSR